MKRIFRIPMHAIGLNPEDYDAYMRNVISDEVSIAVFDCMKEYNKVPKHIEIHEIPPKHNGFPEIEILLEPKTGMYKFNGELLSYDKMCDICYKIIKTYEIEVY